MTVITRSSADLATIIEDIKRLAGCRSDGDSVSVSVGLLNAAVRELEEHTHCDEALDDLRGDESARYDADLAEIEAEHESAIAKLKEDIDIFKDEIASLKDQLANCEDEG